MITLPLPSSRRLLLLTAGVLGVIGVWLTPAANAAPLIPAHFTVSATPSPAHTGEAVTVTVQATVDPGWHIYSPATPQRPEAGEGQATDKSGQHINTAAPVSDGPSATEIKAFGDAVPLGPTTEDAPQNCSMLIFTAKLASTRKPLRSSAASG